MKIKSLHGRQILDSRGNPTVEVELKTTNHTVIAGVPSGASTGSHEAIELRDGKKAYNGKGVTKAAQNVDGMLRYIKKYDVSMQREIDEEMIRIDGSKSKMHLGANAILGVSMAVARAAAKEHKVPLYKYIQSLYGSKKVSLPVPMANILNGGKHAENKLRFQEFMIVPVKSKSFSESVRIVSEVYHTLGRLIHKAFGSTGVGDEGGFAPLIETPQDALDLIETAISEAGYTNKVMISIDAAASEFYDKETKRYDVGFKVMDGEELIKYYITLCRNYNIFSIEDPFHEDDYKHFKELTKKIGAHVLVVGDDLTVSNPKRIVTAADMHLCNALLLKVNQIGTITEALQAAHKAKSKKWKVIVSHRSGETEDTFISDLAVGLDCGFIKLGAPCRGERTAKYNQLLRIEEQLKKS